MGNWWIVLALIAAVAVPVGIAMWKSKEWIDAGFPEDDDELW